MGQVRTAFITFHTPAASRQARVISVTVPQMPSFDLETLSHWLQLPFFTVGKTPINAERLFGLLVLLVGAWWATGRVLVGPFEIGNWSG